MPHSRIIIAGDSNALGFLNTGPVSYVPTVRVQIWTGTAWNYMDPGVNTGTPNHPDCWGCEVQIANRWLWDNPSGYLWIVKNADTVKGGTTLAVDWRQGGPMFNAASNSILAARRNLDGSPYAFSRYDAAFIGIGENDAAHPEMAAVYLSNIAAFIAAAQAVWGVDKIIQHRLHSGPQIANAQVRDAQRQSVRFLTFPTEGLPMRPDGVHFADHVALGDASYDGWVK